jgi:hypothetical protein
MEDVLFHSISSLVSSIEEHRVSELLRNPKEAAESAAGAMTLTQNARLLVDIVKSWNTQIQPGEMKAFDSDVTNEVIEAIFSLLHRWLSWKSLAARLPKSHSSQSSRTKSDADKQHAREKEDWSSYLAGDPWVDADDLAAEDLMAWLVDSTQFREEADFNVGVQTCGTRPLKPVKLIPRHSTETASTSAPSESILGTSRSIASDSSSSFSYELRANKSSGDADKKDFVDCSLSRRLVPVLSLDGRSPAAKSRSRVPVSRMASAPLDASDQSNVKSSFPCLLNPILDADADLPKGDMLPAPASTWPRRTPKESSAACYCIGCLLGIDHLDHHTPQS